jgi:hypothetical protein
VLTAMSSGKAALCARYAPALTPLLNVTVDVTVDVYGYVHGAAEFEPPTDAKKDATRGENNNSFSRLLASPWRLLAVQILPATAHEAQPRCAESIAVDVDGLVDVKRGIGFVRVHGCERLGTPARYEFSMHRERGLLARLCARI